MSTHDDSRPLTAPPTLARALSDSASTLVIGITLAVLSLCSLPWGRDTGYGGAALLAVALAMLVSPVAIWQVRAHTWRAETMRVLRELSEAQGSITSPSD